MALLALFSLTGCDSVHLGYGYETVVVNESGTPYVIEVVHSPHGSRCHAVAPGATVRIDVVAEGNPAPESVALLDRNCRVMQDLSGSYGEGGVITLMGNAPPTFVPNRRITGRNDVSDYLTGSRTCEEAASSL